MEQTIEITLDAPVQYQVILVDGASNASPDGVMDGYVDAERTAHARTTMHQPIHVHGSVQSTQYFRDQVFGFGRQIRQTHHRGRNIHVALQPVSQGASRMSKIVVEEAIVKSRYTVVLLTASYLKDRFKELTTTMAVLQAVHARTRRFIRILRELCTLPLWIQAFEGLDMTPRRTMELRDKMGRLIKRLKKQPHER